jgi:L-alanine-DL-glutamate epimerase-like enolase superfamily enzyme
MLQEPQVTKDGFAIPSEQPGSGVDWDERAIAALSAA